MSSRKIESDEQNKDSGCKKSFTYRPLVNADISVCAHIAGEAFKKDRHTLLKARCPKDPYNHEEGMRGAFAHWLSRPTGTVEGTVAVDQATGEVIGWVVWGFRGFDEEASRLDKVEKKVDNEQKESNASRQAESAPPTTKTTRVRLEEYTSADLQDWMKRLMPPGTRCMFICSIAVHPFYEGQGVGAELVASGTRRADVESVKCWVHSSEAGTKLFQKSGFEQVGSLALDLDAWNDDGIVPPEGEGVKWGMYTLRYMVRPPRKGDSSSSSRRLCRR